jgi:hypothetical protein
MGLEGVQLLMSSHCIYTKLPSLIKKNYKNLCPVTVPQFFDAAL